MREALQEPVVRGSWWCEQALHLVQQPQVLQVRLRVQFGGGAAIAGAGVVGVVGAAVVAAAIVNEVVDQVEPEPDLSLTRTAT